MNAAERRRYGGWVQRAVIRPSAAGRVAGAVKRALANRARIEPVADKLGVPWSLLAALQELEASGRMDRHPANGDLLTGVTVSDPAGMPRNSEPPFSYESVAEEEYDELERPRDGVWTLDEMCHTAEHWNGLGYRRKGKGSPFVLAATNLEERGRYTSDHVYDATAMSGQVGTLALWIALKARGVRVP